MSNPLRAKVFRYRWVIFWIMAIAYVSAFFHRVCPAVVALDIQESFGISAGLVGLLASAYFYSYAFIQFPAGLLSDSLGPRKTVTIFLIIGSLGSILFGMAPQLGVAVVGRILVGLGAGMVFTPTMKILSKWFRVNEFARMNGIFLAMGGVGALTAAAPLASFTGWVGWRAAFEIIGVATLGLGLVVWLVVRDRPQDLGWPSLAEIDPVYGGGSFQERREEIRIWEGARRVLTNRYFWAVAMWSFCSMGVFFSFGGLWAGPYLMHVYHMSRDEAGRVLNMLAVGIVLGSPLMAYLSEKVLHSRRRVLMYAACVLVLTLVLLNAFPTSLPRPILYLAFLIFSACSLAPGVISITTTKELFPVAMTGTSIGTVNLFPFVGGAILQVAAGWVLDAYPSQESGDYAIEAYSAVLRVLLAGGVAALASTFFMKETFPGAQESR